MPRLRHLKIVRPLPWERQPEESDPAWEAFRVFRDMPYEQQLSAATGKMEEPRLRSAREAARRVGKTRALFDKWSQRHSWRNRAAAYDSDIDRDKRATMKRQAVLATAQHAQLAGAGINAVSMPLRALAKPQILTDSDGNALVNEDGEPLTRDRQQDLEKMVTPALLLLMRNVAALMPVLIQIRMEALGNPNEPLPEVPEYGAPEDTAGEVTPPERIRDLMIAMDEAGLLSMAGISEAAEVAATAEAEDIEEVVT